MDLTRKQVMKSLDRWIDDRYNGVISIETPFGAYHAMPSEVMKAMFQDSYVETLFAYMKEHGIKLSDV